MGRNSSPVRSTPGSHVPTLAVSLGFAPWLAWWGTWAVNVVAASLAGGVGGEAEEDDGSPLRFDIVIPAHDEEASIGGLLRSLRAQVAVERLGRILVVADHCHDRTAGLARAEGAEVHQRDDGPPGKPGAVRDGVTLLRSRPDRGDVVVFLDADCVCEPEFLGGLAARFSPGVRAVQASYEIREPDSGAVRAGLRRAFALRNVVRPTGADWLGLPVPLTGSGIALRWDLLDLVSFGDPRVGAADTSPGTDDLLMAIELLEAGVGVGFARGARVTAATMESDDALGAQRIRWEAAQALLWRRAAGAAQTLARRGDWRGLVALVDWTAPPLSVAVATFALAAATTGLAVAAGALSPPALAPPVAAAGVLGVYLVVGLWLLEGPAAVWETAAGAPRFVSWKARLYTSRVLAGR